MFVCRRGRSLDSPGGAPRGFPMGRALLVVVVSVLSAPPAFAQHVSIPPSGAVTVGMALHAGRRDLRHVHPPGRAAPRDRPDVTELVDGHARPSGGTRPAHAHLDDSASSRITRRRLQPSCFRSARPTRARRLPTTASARLPDAALGGVGGPDWRHSAFLAEPRSANRRSGPPAFMHRRSAAENPSAPLGHHTFDVSHVAMGVISRRLRPSAAVVVEASAFHGRWNRMRTAGTSRIPRPARFVGRASLVPAGRALDIPALTRLAQRAGGARRRRSRIWTTASVSWEAERANGFAAMTAAGRAERRPPWAVGCVLGRGHGQARPVRRLHASRGQSRSRDGCSPLRRAPIAAYAWRSRSRRTPCRTTRLSR